MTLDNTQDDAKHEISELEKGDDHVAATDFEYDRQYIVAITPQTDDPETLAFTFRTVFLGTIWAIFLAVANTLFSFRTVSFSLPNGLVQLLAYPMGKFMAYALPKGILNPGPFTIKEHVLIFIIAASAGGKPYGTENVISMYSKYLMGIDGVNFWNSFAFIFATQMTGYGIAGLCRRFLVKPEAMWWPNVLPNVALFTALNSVETDADKITKYPSSRYKMFWMVFLWAFIWHWFPGLFAPVLANIAFLCWFTSNREVRFMASGGTMSGMGLLNISFDWNQISSSFAPIATPWWATANVIISNMVWAWVFIPIFYYTRAWGTPHPLLITNGNGFLWSDNTTVPVLNAPYIFNKDGVQVYVRRVGEKPSAKDPASMLTHDFQINETFVANNSPFFLTEAFAIAYFLSFMNIAAAVSHVYLWYGNDIKTQFKQALQQLHTAEGLTDTHNVLMSKYPDVPEWMYATFTVVCLVMMFLVGSFTPYFLPWWAVILAFVIGAGFTIPIGIIQAITGTQLGLNVITEFVIGLIIPGQGIAVAAFKTFGYNIMIQAMNLVSDLKLGHYLHINPYSMVAAQLIGTLLGIIFNTESTFYILDSLTSPKVFVDEQWKALGHQTFLSAIGIWGYIGPARFFGAGTPYFSFMLAFPFGLLLPLLPWLGNKYYPSKKWHYINIPLITNFGLFSTNCGIAISGLAVGYLFQYHIKKHYPDWFKKYNYVFAIAMDSGAAICVFVISLLQLISPELSYPQFGVNILNPGQLVPDYYCLEQDPYKG